MILLLFSFTLVKAITLEESINIALKNNTHIRLAELDLKRTEEEITKARSGILPNVTLSYSYTRFDRSLSFGFTPRNRHSYLFELRQNIFDKSVFDALKVASMSKELQRYILEDVKRDVENQTKQMFYALLYKKEVVNLAKENLSYWEENYRLVENQYKAGIKPKVELLRSKAQLESARAEYQQTLADYRGSLEDFKAYLRMDQDVEPEGSLRFEEKVDLSKGIEGNSTILVAKKSLDVSERKIDVAKDAYFPTLSGFATYQGNTGRRSFTGGTEWISGYTFGFQLSYELFDGFYRKANVAQANIDYIKQKENLLDTEYRMWSQLRKTIEDITSLRAQIKATEESLKAAEEALKLATERYKYGVGTQLEVLDARNNYNQTLSHYHMLLYLYMSDLSYYDRLTR
ncbi:MAG: TolC family protein [Aquificaceae bacterium]